MGLRINSSMNFFALAELELAQIAIQEMSSGMINGDPNNLLTQAPAEFSQNTNLNTEIGGLNQANQNIDQGLGLLQTASSAVGNQISLVQQMQQIAEQASTASASDLPGLNAQMQSLLSQYEQITSTTQFNGINLLDGTFVNQTFQTGPNAGNTMNVNIDSTQASTIFQTTVGTGTFQPAKTYAAGSYPAGEAFGDFNRDGSQDVVSAESGSNVVDVYINNGSGTYASPVKYTVGSQPAAVQVSDVNGDGIADIVTQNTDNTVSVLLGNGDGTFKPEATFTTGSEVGGPGGLGLADLNHDGKLDIVTADSGSGTISVLLGNGNGTFQAPLSLNTSGSIPGGIAIGDVNGDGIPDIATADVLDKQMDVFLGNGNGTFQAPIIKNVGDYADDITMGDFNNDGKMDIVTSNFNGGVSLFTGDGSGGFTKTNIGVSSSQLSSIRAADLNSDGNLDLILSDTSNGTTVLYGNGNGTFKSPITMGTSAQESIVGDVNGDGVPDIVTTNGSLNYLSVFIQNTTRVSALPDFSLTSNAAAQKLLPILSSGLNQLQSVQANINGSQSALQEAQTFSQNMDTNLTNAQNQQNEFDSILTAEQNWQNEQNLQRATYAATVASSFSSQFFSGLIGLIQNNNGG